jgi:hypothetical protein
MDPSAFPQYTIRYQGSTLTSVNEAPDRLVSLAYNPQIAYRKFLARPVSGSRHFQSEVAAS